LPVTPAPAPTVRVRLFAVLRELAGASEVDVSQAATVQDVVDELGDRFGERFSKIAAVSSVVVDGERATPAQSLTGIEEVALLPPVSGGAPRKQKAPARPKKVLLLVNPRARSVSQANVEVIEKALSVDFDLTVAETARRGHGAETAQQAVKDGFHMIVVFSGDGTINEVVNGMANTGVALGIIPGGATNVLARILGIPTDPVEATAQLINLALEARARRLHLGDANGRFFVINCGVGLDAAIMARVESQSPSSKTSHERVALFASMREVGRYMTRKPEMTIRVDGGLELAAISVLIGKLNPYAFFKNWEMKLTPEASLHGGLDVLAVQQISSIAVPKIAYQVFVSGDITNNPAGHYSHNVGEIEISSPGRSFPVQVDGDYVGDHNALNVRLVRDALWVVA
jgi:diacylglycerol kinase family enzyme/molybdopterin converting factor small subunit